MFIRSLLTIDQSKYFTVIKLYRPVLRDGFKQLFMTYCQQNKGHARDCLTLYTPSPLHVCMLRSFRTLPKHKIKRQIASRSVDVCMCGGYTARASDFSVSVKNAFYIQRLEITWRGMGQNARRLGEEKSARVHFPKVSLRRLPIPLFVALQRSNITRHFPQ